MQFSTNLGKAYEIFQQNYCWNHNILSWESKFTSSTCMVKMWWWFETLFSVFLRFKFLPWLHFLFKSWEIFFFVSFLDDDLVNLGFLSIICTFTIHNVTSIQHVTAWHISYYEEKFTWSQSSYRVFHKEIWNHFTLQTWCVNLPIFLSFFFFFCH